MVAGGAGLAAAPAVEAASRGRRHGRLADAGAEAVGQRPARPLAAASLSGPTAHAAAAAAGAGARAVVVPAAAGVPSLLGLLVRAALTRVQHQRLPGGLAWRRLRLAEAWGNGRCQASAVLSRLLSYKWIQDAREH